MTYLNAQDIVLPSPYFENYDEILEVVRNEQASSGANKFFVSILESELYSIDFKKKLIRSFPTVQQGRLWAYSNLEGEALYGCVVTFLRDAPLQFDKKDVEYLTSNPALTAYSNESHDVVEYLLKKLSNNIFPDDYTHAEYFLECLIELDLMTLEVAGKILSINAGIHELNIFVQKSYNEALLIAWARAKYGLDGLPDSWVLKFLVGE